MVDVTERRRLEAAREEARREHMELVRRVLTLQEAERRRIARDIHDDLGQQVTALRLKLEWLAARPAEDEELDSRVHAVQEAAERVDQHIDFLLRDLRPAGLDELGLLAVLRQTVADWSATFGIAATFRAVGVDAGRLPHEVETQAFRIVQEALNNVHKHAAATQVKVALERRRGRTVLTVADNGIGLVASSASAAAGRAAPRPRPARHARAGDADRRSAGPHLDARQRHHRHASCFPDPARRSAITSATVRPLRIASCATSAAPWKPSSSFSAVAAPTVRSA